MADIPNLDSLLATALQSMLPKVNNGLSVVNFILELKDLRRMFDFKTLDKLLYRLSSSSSKWKYKKEYVKGITAKDAAGDYLNYNFGWRPFVGDLLAMMKTLGNLSKRLKYLENNANKLVRRHTSINLDALFDLPADNIDETSISTAMGFLPMPDLGYVVSRKAHARWVYRPRLHATIEYYYTLPKVSELRRKIRGYLDAFGVRLDPSIIWNAIPLSFVVDWVIDVGGFLRRFTPTDLGMNVVISDASYSYKYHYLGEMTVKAPRSTTPPLGEVEVLVLNDDIRKYERAKWIPNLFATSTGLPTGMQYSLGGALLISKSRPPKLKRH
jgi:hypothetical protein